MFLRKLIGASLIISASIGSSIAMGTHNEVLRINTEEVEQGVYINLVPKAPTHRLASSFEELRAKLIQSTHLIVFTDLKTSTKEKIATEERRAQKAQRNAQRQALHKLTKSFKAPIKPIHQPR